MQELDRIRFFIQSGEWVDIELKAVEERVAGGQRK